MSGLFARRWRVDVLVVMPELLIEALTFEAHTGYIESRRSYC